MDQLLIATIVGFSILVASMLSAELGLSVAIIEIAFGVVAGNAFDVISTPWIDFLASFAGIVLTFLAGAEVDPALLRRKLKESLLIGGLSFLLPFVGAGLFASVVAGWDLRQSEIAGIAMSTTSLAVVYAVLVETGLTNTEIGKTIMAATFVTHLGTALALSLLFIRPTPYLGPFVGVSTAAIVAMLLLERWFFAPTAIGSSSQRSRGRSPSCSCSCGRRTSPRAKPSCPRSSSASPLPGSSSAIRSSIGGSGSSPSPSSRRSPSSRAA